MKKLLWPVEVARELGVTSKTVNRWSDAGAVACIRDVKGRRRYTPDAIDTLKRWLGLQGANHA
jgi:DNA-binding transcriptional MerR regulator